MTDDKPSADSRPTVYDGPLPVPIEDVTGWHDAGVEVVRIHFTTTLDDLIYAGDMGAWNDTVDDLIGISMTDLSYGVVREAAGGDDLGDDGLILWVEGAIDWDMIYLEDE